MKVNFGKQTWLLPMPVLILGAYDESGNPNAMNAAWGGVHDYNEIGVCISKGHKTTKNILATGAFTVAIADAKHVLEADYVGIASGNKDADKMKKSGLTPVRSGFVNAPVFDEFPLTIECELKSYDEESGYMIGSVVNVCADENVLTDGKPDVAKIDPIIFETIGAKYMTLGKVVGNAFSDGKKLGE